MIGSREQDLTGDDIIMRQISVAVHGRKDVSDERAVSSTTGFGAAVVSARTSSTLRYGQKMIQHMSAGTQLIARPENSRQWRRHAWATGALLPKMPPSPLSQTV